MRSVHSGMRSDHEAVADALTALNSRLEGIRREHLERNRSNLREFTSEQLKEVDRLTAAITAKIFSEVASELQQSIASGQGREISKTVTLMLGLTV